MIRIFFILLASQFSCQKEDVPLLTGKWSNDNCTYDFHSELTITQDGILENYCYFIQQDTIYLDYGLPFKIELLTDLELTLSKNDGGNYLLLTEKSIEFKKL